jgi:hypothetical protein
MIDSGEYGDAISPLFTLFARILPAELERSCPGSLLPLTFLRFFEELL